jgi:hypothetical protein
MWNGSPFATFITFTTFITFQMAVFLTGTVLKQKSNETRRQNKQP